MGYLNRFSNPLGLAELEIANAFPVFVENPDLSGLQGIFNKLSTVGLANIC